MKFDRESAADEAAKSFAKNKAKSAAATAGKTAAKTTGKAAQWLFLKIAAVLGLPFTIIIIVCLFLLILPSVIFSSTAGLDNKFPTDNTIDINAAIWEENAEEAIRERKEQLYTVTFWDDLGSFFTGGGFGSSREIFKTEFAQANETDENGDSISAGYYSSSNRMIALINEAFRSSLRNGTTGFINPVVRKSKQLAEQREEEVRANVESFVPRTNPDGTVVDDYVVEFETEWDSKIEERNYIYESCYLLAAGSSYVNKHELYADGVKTILDFAFEITGVDISDTEKICWEPTNVVKYEYRDELYNKTPVYKTIYTGYDEVGNMVFSSSSDESSRYPNVVRVETRQELDYWIQGTRRIVTATVIYTVTLKANYKDIVNEACEIETELPSGAPVYEITEKEQVEVSTMELTKMYAAGEFLDMGDFALPLTPGTYYISSKFGPRPIIPGVDESGYHPAWDLAGKMGDPIFAVMDGTVAVGFDPDGYGNYITITHTDGTKTRYAHMSSTVADNGATVTKGAVIGLMGSTGASTGPHLHFEIIDSNGVRVDPQYTNIGQAIEENQ